MRCASPQEGAIDREVFTAQRRIDHWCGQQEFEELGHELLLVQQVLVLGEGFGMPNEIVWLEASEPKEKQIVVVLLNQNALQANAVDRPLFALTLNLIYLQ